jgi:hypothetical protein
LGKTGSFKSLACFAATFTTQPINIYKGWNLFNQTEFGTVQHTDFSVLNYRFSATTDAESDHLFPSLFRLDIVIYAGQLFFFRRRPTRPIHRCETLIDCVLPFESGRGGRP